MKIGFTGTQNGLNEFQLRILSEFIVRIRSTMREFHHGDCIGADAQAHDLVRELAPNCKIVVHPPDLDHKRAFKRGDVMLPELPYLVRNRAIVDACDKLVAGPKEAGERRRSGTWATVRYAESRGVPMFIVFPEKNQ